MARLDHREVLRVRTRIGRMSIGRRSVIVSKPGTAPGGIALTQRCSLLVLPHLAADRMLRGGVAARAEAPTATARTTEVDSPVLPQPHGQAKVSNLCERKGRRVQTAKCAAPNSKKCGDPGPA